MAYWRALKIPKPTPNVIQKEHRGTKCFEARVNPEGRTGFPYDLFKTSKTDYYAEDVDELRDDETFELINLIGALGAEEAVQNPVQHNIFTSEQAIHFTDDPGDLADDEENPARLVDESDDEGSAPKLLTVKQEEDRDTDNEKGCPSNQEDRDDSHCELHTLSPSLIPRIPLPATNKRPSVISYILKCPEEDYISRVREELGYELSPVLGGFIEEMVHEKWAESRKKSCLLDSSQVETDIHSLVVDAQVKLAKLIERYFDKCSESTDIKRLLALKHAAREVLGCHHSDIESSSSENEQSSSEEVSSDSADSSIGSDDDSSGMESWNENSIRSEISNDSDEEVDSKRDSKSRTKCESVSASKYSTGLSSPRATQTSPRKLTSRTLQRLEVERVRKGITPRKRTLSSSMNDELSSISRTDREEGSPKRRKLFHSTAPSGNTLKHYQTRSRTRLQSSTMKLSDNN